MTASRLAPPTTEFPNANNPLVVVGIGADGVNSLTASARRAIAGADVLLGAPRQLELIPAELSSAPRHAWPRPMMPELKSFVHSHCAEGVHVVALASGDPTFFGLGNTLVRLFGAGAVQIIPTVSSFALACARLGWQQQTTRVASVLTDSLDTLGPLVDDGQPLIILLPRPETIQDLCAWLVAHGQGETPLHLLTDLGTEAEQHCNSTASAPEAFAGIQATLAIAALDPQPGLSRAPGRPDDTYLNDGQLTKADVRALTLAALAPRPGELLWDVGAGSGSISIEWCRLAPGARAVACELNPVRAERAAANAAGLPVDVLIGGAPDCFNEMRERSLQTAPSGVPLHPSGIATNATTTGIDPAAPDAIFIGGGATAPGAVENAWKYLAPGGRMVINAVTWETEQLVLGLHARWGGELTHIQISTPRGIGKFHAWHAAYPVVRWVGYKPMAMPEGT